MKIGERPNHYGRIVGVHRCDDCGREFTVTTLREDWGGCLSEDCVSYDITRDADLFFDAAVEAGWVRRSVVGQSGESK